MSDRYEADERWLTDDGEAIVVRWGDGHVSTYSLPYLRGYCPCAACQGHGPGPLTFVPPPADLALVGVRLVGGYGFSAVWADGHDTGIYANRPLRRMCPCAECLDVRALGGPLHLLADAP